LLSDTLSHPDRNLHSFPTRRSSDLKKVAKETAEMGIDRLWETIDEKLTLLRSLDVDPGDIEPILGQLLFEVVHLSRYHEINPELALSQAVNRYMEKYEKQ